MATPSVPITKVSMNRSDDDGDDLVVEHRLNVDEVLYFEKRCLRVKSNEAQNEDVYFLHILRRIDDAEFIFEVSNYEASPGTARVKVETSLSELGRHQFYENWRHHWSPTLPTSPVVPHNVDHVVNVEPFDLCPLSSLSELVEEYHMQEPSLAGTIGLEMEGPKHTWEYETRKKMPSHLDRHALSEAAERAGEYVGGGPPEVSVLPAMAEPVHEPLHHGQVSYNMAPRQMTSLEGHPAVMGNPHLAARIHVTAGETGAMPLVSSAMEPMGPHEGGGAGTDNMAMEMGGMGMGMGGMDMGIMSGMGGMGSGMGGMGSGMGGMGMGMGSGMGSGMKSGRGGRSGGRGGRGNLNASAVESESSSVVLKKVICEEIIPPMAQGLQALERALCRGPEMVGVNNDEDFEVRVAEDRFGDDIDVSLFARNQSFGARSAGASKKSVTRSAMRSRAPEPEPPLEFLAKIQIHGSVENRKEAAGAARANNSSFKFR